VECEGGDWPESASEVIWDLLTAALEGDGGRDASPGRTNRLRREATVIVDNRLADPGFRSTGIAEALGVSDRYVQRAFAEIGTTPSRVLLARRLDAAAARLRRAGRSGRITAIALECGFSDVSYFSRVFRHRFGVSARTYQLRFGERATGHD
jgi:AraC-like DNA-binding protein